MNLYHHHSDRELVAVLEQSHKLTYEAQRSLKAALESRNIKVNTAPLEEAIAQKEAHLKDLVDLKDLGFEAAVDEQQRKLTLRRTSKAMLLDAVATVLGALLTVVGLVHFFLLIALFSGDNEFSIGKLLMYGLLITLGVIGFKMLSGVHRLLNYFSFNLDQQGDHVTLAFKGKTATYTSSEVRLTTLEDELVLQIGEEPVVVASAGNLKQKTTLEALIHKMKTIG